MAGILRVLQLTPTVQTHACWADECLYVDRRSEREWLFVSVWPCDGLLTCPRSKSIFHLLTVPADPHGPEQEWNMGDTDNTDNGR